MNWKVFLQSLSAAAIGGAVGAVPTYMSQSLQTTGKVDWQTVGAVAALSALTGVSGFLTKSPLQSPPTPPPTKPPTQP